MGSKQISLNSIKKNNETAVSNVFLDYYMGDANGEFVKVYLYLLRCIGRTDSNVTISGIADTLNLTEKDIIRALNYWNKKAVLDVVFDADREPSSITFLPLEALEALEALDSLDADKPLKDAETSELKSVNEELSATDETITEEAVCKNPVAVNRGSDKSADNNNNSGSRPVYSAAQLKALKEQEDIKQLLYIVEKYLEKTLNATDMSTIIYIYSDLGFDEELVEYLVEYCVSNNHRSLYYIEKVALNWHAEGITTVSAARENAAIRNTRTHTVCTTFGIGDRNITPAEMEFITKWYSEYGFDTDMVEEACRRTIMSVSKPSFSYADGILKKWRSANIYTMADLKKLDAGFKAKISVPVTAKLPAKTTGNKFNNYSQRSYNFDELEKRLVSKN